jgi:hypothetical protein
MNSITATAHRNAGRGTYPTRLLGLTLALTLAASGGWAAYQHHAAQQEQARQAAVADELAKAETAFGIHVERLSVTAAGYMLDLRYRVTDVAKAAPLLDQKVRPHIVTGSQARLEVPQTPTVGTLKQSTKNPKAGQIYFAMVANPGKMVKSGDEVTVVMGDFKASVKVR